MRSHASAPARAISRVVDINALIRSRDNKAAAPVKAVFVLFNQAPYAIIARKSRGITALSDLEGKNLGVAEGDLSIRLWPAVARQNGIKLSQREAEQHQPRGARADAVGRAGRCRHRLLLFVRRQPQGSRRAGR